jgi:hypothetical protein
MRIKKTTKYISAIITAVFIVIAASGLFVGAADDYSFNINALTNENAGINGFSGESAEIVVIPEMIDGYTITKISKNAFPNYGYKITNLTIPQTVSNIEPLALYNLTALESITLSGDNPYFELVDGILYNEDKTSLILCPPKKQDEFKIPDTVVQIQAYAFDRSEAPHNLVLSDNVKEIGEYAFSDCRNLISIKLPDGLTEIPHGLFSGCALLDNVVIPDSVNSIGEYTFSGCQSLSAINIPNGVPEIGNYCFNYCESLKEITLPESVRNIDYGAFNNCTYLENINISEQNPNYKSIDGVVFNKDMTLLITCPMGKMGEYTVPDNVKIISRDAFRDCETLTNIILPESLEAIGEQAFVNCKRLSSIEIPNSVSYLGDYAFARCENLSEVLLPDGIRVIGENTFLGCSSLKSVEIPENVFGINDGAFSGCSSLTKVSIPSGVLYFEDDIFEDSPRVKINGVSGSAAELYALNNDIPFEAVSESEATKISAPSSAQTPAPENDKTSFGDVLISAGNILIIIAAAAALFAVVMYIIHKRKTK